MDCSQNAPLPLPLLAHTHATELIRRYESWRVWAARLSSYKAPVSALRQRIEIEMESGSVRFRRLEGQADPGPSGLMGLVGLAAFVAAVSLIISVVSIGVALSVAAPTTNPTPSPPSPAPPAPPAGPDDCCTDFSNVTCSYYCLRHGQHVLSETVRFEPAQPELGITIEGRSAELVFPPDFNGSAALSFSAPGVFNTRVFINNLVINLEGTTATLLYALYFDQVHSSIKLDHIDVNSFTWRNQTGVYFESVNDYSNGTSDDRFALGPHVTNRWVGGWVGARLLMATR